MIDLLLTLVIFFNIIVAITLLILLKNDTARKKREAEFIEALSMQKIWVIGLQAQVDELFKRDRQ